MTINRDNSGSFFGVNLTGSAVGQTKSLSIAASADLLVAIEVSTTGAPANVKFNGIAPTLSWSQGSNNTSTGGTYLYWFQNAGIGGALNLTFDAPASTWFSVAWESLTGVGSVSATAIKAYGSSNTPSSGAITLALGQWAFSAVGFGGTGNTRTLNSTSLVTSGGTAQQTAQDANKSTAIAIFDFSASDTATDSLSGTATWSAITVILTPAPNVAADAGIKPRLRIANRNVGPRAKRRRWRPPVVHFLRTPVPHPIRFDQAGTGYNQAVVGSSGQWTDHATEGSYIIVAASVFVNAATYDDLAGVTCNGVPMQRLGTNYFGGVPAYGALAFYGLANAPAGPKTIQFNLVTSATTSSAYVNANSFSYTGVQSVSAFPWPASGTGTTASQTIANPDGCVTFQAFGANIGPAFTGLTGPGNIKWNTVTYVAGTTYVGSLAVQDSFTSGSGTFSATMAGSELWAGLGVVMSQYPAPVYPDAPQTKLLTKFQNQQDASIQFFGDSTTFGYLDEQNLGGWVARFGIYLGQYYDYNVVERYISSSYATPVSLYTARRGGSAPTLTIYNGGVSGTTLIAQVNEITSGSMAAISNPDLIFDSTGINEAVGGPPSWNSNEYTNLYHCVLGYTQNVYCPGVPIIVTTESTFGGTYASNLPAYQANFLALAQSLVGSWSPNGDPLVQGPNNVSVLDTQQATLYQNQAGLFNPDAVHPNAAGYARIAHWVASILFPWTVTPRGTSMPPMRIANKRVGPAALRHRKRNTPPTVFSVFNVAPMGIPSEEAFGTPSVAKLGQFFYPTGIPSEEAFGTPTVVTAARVWKAMRVRGIPPGHPVLSYFGTSEGTELGHEPLQGRTNLGSTGPKATISVGRSRKGRLKAAPARVSPIYPDKRQSTTRLP